MNQAEQLRIIDLFDKELVEILKSKGADYATKDVLSNFKKISTVIRELEIDTTTSTGYALLMVILKVCRIANLLKHNKEPNNESVGDSFKDGVNYLKLAYLCEIDNQNESKKES